MSDVMVLEDAVDGNWVRSFKALAARAEALDEGHSSAVPLHAEVRRFEDDIHLHHLEARWPAREVIRVALMEGGGAYMLVVAWWIGDERVSQAMLEAGTVFALAFGQDPMCAFIGSIPAGVEEFVEVHGISLVKADWVPKGFLAVTSGGMWRNLPAMKVGKEA